MAVSRKSAVELVLTAKDLTAAGISSVKQGLASIPQSAKAAYQAAATYLTYRVSVDGVGEFVKLGDAWAQIQARLRLATTSQESYNQAADDTFRIAQTTRTALDAIAGLYGKTAQSLRALGGTQQQAADLTQLIAQSFKISGANAENASAGILQFTQALQGGVLRGDEFNSVMENAPRLAQALADGLGVPIGALRKMAEAGELTSNKLVGALLGQKDKIAAEYGQIPKTVEGALTQAQNALLKFVGELNSSYGITQRLAAGISALAQNIDVLAAGLAAVSALLAGRLVRSGAAYAAGLVEQARATRAAAVAAKELQAAKLSELKTAAQQANIAKASAAAAVTEARLQQSLATNTKQREAATKALNKALDNHVEAVTAAGRAGVAYDAALDSGTKKTSLFGKVLGVVGKVGNVLEAFFIGFEIGNMLNQFELVRKAGSYLAEGFAILAEGIHAAFSDDTLDVGRIHAEFEAVREGLTDAAQAEEENRKAKAASAAATTEAVGAEQAYAEAMREAVDAAKARLDTAAAATQMLQAEYDGRLELAKVAQASAQASATEAAALGRSADARRFELQAIEAAGEVKRLEVLQARALQQAKQAEAKAARDHAQAIETEAQAVGGLDAKELSAIASAKADVAAKQQAADAARAHADSLARLPVSAAAATNSLALQNAAVQRYYQEAFRAVQAARELQAAFADGSASAQEVAAAEATAADAMARLGAATEAYTEKQRAADEALNESIDSFRALDEARARSFRANQAAADQAAAYSRAAAKAADETGRWGTAADRWAESGAQFLSLTGGIYQALAQYSTAAATAYQRNAELAATWDDLWQVMQDGERTLAKISEELTAAAAAQAGLQKATASGVGLVAAIRDAQRSFTLLDSEHLDGLNAALQAARDKLQSIRDAAKATAEGLQSELFGLQGNDAAAEQLRYQQQQAALQKQLQAAREAGDAESIRTLTQSLRLAAQIHAQKLATITAEKAGAGGDPTRAARSALAQAMTEAAAKSKAAAAEIISATGQAAAQAAADLAAQIAGIRSDLVSANSSIDDAIRQAREANYTEEEKRVSQINALREKQSAAQKALAENDIARARELNNQVVSMAQALGTAVRDAAGNTVVDQARASKETIGILEQAKRFNESIAAAQEGNAAADYQKKLTAIETEKAAKLAAVNEVLNQELAAANQAHAQRMAAIEAEKQAGIAAAKAVAAATSGGRNTIGGGSGGGKLSSGYSVGGLVGGTGAGDVVPAMLEPGEYVIRKAAAQRLGAGFLAALNAGMAPIRRSMGGPVPSPAAGDGGPSIAIDLNLGGQTARGSFPAGPAVDAIVRELKKAGRVSSR